MSRLTRKEMKRDEVLEGAARLMHLLQEHARTLLLGLAAVALAALLVAGWFALDQRRETQANEALSRALELFRAEIDAAAPNPNDPLAPTFGSEADRSRAAKAAFEAVRTEHGSSKVAAVAAGYLAEIAAGEGDEETARALWAEVSGRPETALDIELWVNRLAADRAAGRSDAVLSELQGLLGDGSTSVPEVILLDQMAETLLALDRGAEARDIYQRILDEHPGSAYAQRAGAAIQAL